MQWIGMSNVYHFSPLQITDYNKITYVLLYTNLSCNLITQALFVPEHRHRVYSVFSIHLVPTILKFEIVCAKCLLTLPFNSLYFHFVFALMHNSIVHHIFSSSNTMIQIWLRNASLKTNKNKITCIINQW